MGRGDCDIISWIAWEPAMARAREALVYKVVGLVTGRGMLLSPWLPPLILPYSCKGWRKTKNPGLRTIY